VGRAVLTGLLLALGVLAGALHLVPARTGVAVVSPARSPGVADAADVLRAPAAVLERSSERTSVATIAETVLAAPRACPELGRLVAAQARHLRERTRSLERDWVADCARAASDLDAHCARALLLLAADPARDGSERLAALSLAAADADLAQELVLEAHTLDWLWQRIDGVSPPGSVEHLLSRDEACVAALCLARLGGALQRNRLVQALEVDARAEAAIFGLVHARHADVAQAFLGALESGRASGPRAMLVVVRSGGGLGFPLAAHERERAAQAVEGWWLDQPAGSERLALGSVALALLDTDAAGRAWRARLDARGYESGTARWSVPALLRGADGARLEQLLWELDPAGRLEVALAALERMHPQDSDPLLRAACIAVVTQTLLEAESPQARLQAVRALARSQAWTLTERGALQSAVADPDERVRRVARHALDAAWDG
jgi:hypothetical protein